ncbi:unnamed protein product [Eretmochelys imbricata]
MGAPNRPGPHSPECRINEGSGSGNQPRVAGRQFALGPAPREPAQPSPKAPGSLQVFGLEKPTALRPLTASHNRCYQRGRRRILQGVEGAETPARSVCPEPLPAALGRGRRLAPSPGAKGPAWEFPSAPSLPGLLGWSRGPLLQGSNSRRVPGCAPPQRCCISHVGGGTGACGLPPWGKHPAHKLRAGSVPRQSLPATVSSPRSQARHPRDCYL